MRVGSTVKPMRTRNIEAEEHPRSRGRGQHPVSTNVSSPIAAPPKRRVTKRKLTRDEDVTGVGRNQKHRNGYHEDGFVVGDEMEAEDSNDDAFEPIRDAGRPAKSKSKTRLLGADPITTDQQLDSLNDIHQEVVADFVNHARQVFQHEVTKKSLRQIPFSDGMFRKMAMDFPDTLEELMRIPAIEKERVQIYGSKLLKMIRTYKTNYDNMMRSHEDKPEDPNHAITVDLVSDDEEGQEDEYSDLELSQVEESGYFSSNAQPISGSLQRFTAPAESAPRPRMQSASRAQTSRSIPWSQNEDDASRGNGFQPRRKKSTWTGPRKNSHGNSKGRASGGSRRTSGGGRSNGGGRSGRGGGGMNSRRAPATSGFGGGGIRMMDT